MLQEVSETQKVLSESPFRVLKNIPNNGKDKPGLIVSVEELHSVLRTLLLFNLNYI